ncbi:hypothetical protein N1851_029728 [Merluccius polli]|uniref:Uncharacterized protein n=1 Tax=Merluccius polli TaxID=89951 RepID=A0AA47NRF6_MERPO|nr:hypothetical protein N1851_029728 [Merluccius polli]
MQFPKTAYISKFGLAPYIADQIVADANKNTFVLMFDESLNQTTKTKQLDLHVCFGAKITSSPDIWDRCSWDMEQPRMYCAILKMQRTWTGVSCCPVSMDGPNVNWKFLELLQQEQAEQYGGAQLIVVGSCSLHTLHNACKPGFTIRQLEKELRAMHIFFHNMPARREDFPVLTKSTQFPLPFCGHRWLENLPVVERALEVWPSGTMYMDAVRNEGNYIICILRHFIKREVLQDISLLQLVRLDVGTSKIGELTVLEFRRDCIKVMSTILQKVQDKSPLKYPTVRQVTCLDPRKMFSDPDCCKGKMRNLVQRFLQDKQVSGGVSAGDVITHQYCDFESFEARNDTFLSYRPTETRVDVFLHHAFLSQHYSELWEFCISWPGNSGVRFLNKQRGGNLQHAQRHDGHPATDLSLSLRSCCPQLKEVSGFDDETQTYKTPSLALKLGHTLKRICNIIHFRAVVAENDEQMKSAAAFKSLSSSKWSEHISHNAPAATKFNKPSTTFARDVQLFYQFLIQKAADAMERLEEHESPHVYAELSKATLTQVIIFNRHRAGEVSKMSIKSFNERDKTALHEDIAAGLSNYEKKLFPHLSRVEMCKQGRILSVLLPPDLINALMLLVRKREACGVLKDNPFLFARLWYLTAYKGQEGNDGNVKKMLMLLLAIEYGSLEKLKGKSLINIKREDDPKRKRPWSETEVKSVMKYFKRHIFNAQNATNRECEQCKNGEDPIVKDRSIQYIQDFVRNRGLSYKKKHKTKTVNKIALL